MDTLQVKSCANLPEDEVIVRNACPSDLSGLYDIMKSDPIMGNNLPTATRLQEEVFESSVPWCHIIVAEKDGQALGAAVYFRDYWTWSGRTLRLQHLSVRRNGRHRGVGARLFREIGRFAFEENAQLDWYHAASNSTAAEFFSQFKPNINNILDGIYLMKMIPQAPHILAKNDERPRHDILVRMARSEDVTEINNIIHEISAFQECLEGPTLFEKDLLEDGFTCTPPWFFAIVACRGDHVVGAVLGHRTYTNWTPSFFLQNLYVRSTARRCGLADRLISEFNRVAIEEGAREVYFNVSPDNAPALALYKRYDAGIVDEDNVAFRLKRDQLKIMLERK